MPYPMYLTVYLVNEEGVRAPRAARRYVEGARLEAVVADASAAFERFVVLDERYAQHHASDPRDAVQPQAQEATL